MLILPDEPDPTTALIIPGVTTVYDVAAIPPKLMVVVPLKF